jgi:hypothetical protein
MQQSDGPIVYYLAGDCVGVGHPQRAKLQQLAYNNQPSLSNRLRLRRLRSHHRHNPRAPPTDARISGLPKTLAHQ